MLSLILSGSWCSYSYWRLHDWSPNSSWLLLEWGTIVFMSLHLLLKLLNLESVFIRFVDEYLFNLLYKLFHWDVMIDKISITLCHLLFKVFKGRLYLDLEDIELVADTVVWILHFVEFVISVASSLDQDVSGGIWHGWLHILQCWSSLEQLFKVFDLPHGVSFKQLEVLIELIKPGLSFLCQLVNTFIKLIVFCLHPRYKLLFYILQLFGACFFCYHLINIVLLFFKMDFRRVLKLLELDTGATNDIDCFHEAFHALPHIGNRHFKLILQFGSERNFVLT